VGSADAEGGPLWRAEPLPEEEARAEGDEAPVAEALPEAQRVGVGVRGGPPLGDTAGLREPAPLAEGLGVLDNVEPPYEREGAAERDAEDDPEARAVSVPLAVAEGAGESEPLPPTDAVGDGEAVSLCEGSAEREPAAEALCASLAAAVALPLAQNGGVPVRVRSAEALGLPPGGEGVRGALAQPLCEPRELPVSAGDCVRRPLAVGDSDTEGGVLREEEGQPE